MNSSAPRCACGGGDAVRVVTTAPPYSIVECRRCGLRFPDPFPTSAEIAGQYDDYGGYATDDRLQADLARGRMNARRLLSKIEAVLGRKPRGRFLELGCAAGALVKSFADLTGLECRALEVDRRNATVAESMLGAGRVFAGPLEDANYPDAFFEVVYAEEVIEHVPDPMAFLREIRRILTPGGVVVLSTPNFRGVSARLLGVRWKEFAPAEHIRMFSPRAIRTLATKAGLDVVRVTTGGFSFKVRATTGVRDIFPFSRDRLWVRVASRALGRVGMADGLQMIARAPTSAYSA